MSRHAFRRRLGLVLRAALGLLVLMLAILLPLGWQSFGQRATGARLQRMQHSPQWKDGHFENPQPLRNDAWGSLLGALHVDPHASPQAPLPAQAPLPQWKQPPPTGLRVTWLGHSTTLVEVDGHRFLTDPLFSPRSSPFTFLGPTRWNPPLVTVQDLPPLDGVLISHDHYDHLDRATIQALDQRQVTFFVPLGVGAHLEYWGVPEARIVELDWNQEHAAGDLRVVCVPARHASGRTGFDKDATLWAGWALLGPRHRVYFSGDTGLFPAMADLGRRLGPFDLTLIEVGQYDPAWPDWHIGPEQAVRAHGLLQGRVLVPIHWGLLQLAYHGWTEPVERARAEAVRRGVTIAIPQPGQAIEPQQLPPLPRWWPKLPWRTAAQVPIVSTQVESLAR